MTRLIQDIGVKYKRGSLMAEAEQRRTTRLGFLSAQLNAIKAFKTEHGREPAWDRVSYIVTNTEQHVRVELIERAE